MNIIHLKQTEFPIPEGKNTEAACQQVIPRARFAFVEAPDKVTVFEAFTARICDDCLYICLSQRMHGQSYTYGLLPGQDSIPLPQPHEEETCELCHVS